MKFPGRPNTTLMFSGKCVSVFPVRCLCRVLAKPALCNLAPLLAHPHLSLDSRLLIGVGVLAGPATLVIFLFAGLCYSQGLMRSPSASTTFCKRSGNFLHNPSTS